MRGVASSRRFPPRVEERQRRTPAMGGMRLGALGQKRFGAGKSVEIFWLVVSTQLKNMSQNGNLPQVGVKIKNI